MLPALERWLLGRHPRVPESFLPHLLGGREEGVPGETMLLLNARKVSSGGPLVCPGETLVGPLAELALSALAEAARSPGRDRDSAFRLLAGDAFLTYACEASLQADDVRAELAGLLAGVGGRFG